VKAGGRYARQLACRKISGGKAVWFFVHKNEEKVFSSAADYAIISSNKNHISKHRKL
jgi:hypothetical protein